MANKYTDAVFAAKLPMRDKAVLSALAHRTDNGKGTCWPSYSTIARDAGCSRSTAEKAVNALLKLGIISVVGKEPTAPGKWNNIYRLDLGAIQALPRTGNRYRTGPNTIPESGTVPDDGCDTVPGGGAHSTATRSQNSSLNSPNRTRDNNNHPTTQSETERTNLINLDPEKLAVILRDTLHLTGSVSDLKALPDLPTQYLSDAAEWAAPHRWWSRLHGETFQDFVRACLKEKALLDQFEKARKAGWVHPARQTSESEESATHCFEIVED